MAQLTHAEYQRALQERFDQGAASRDAEVADLKRFVPLTSFVVVSKKFAEPTIRVNYTEDALRIEVPAGQFVRSLARATRHPSGIITRAQLEAELLRALAAVEEEMKAATIHQPPPRS